MIFCSKYVLNGAKQVQMADTVFLSLNRYEHSLLYETAVEVNVLGSEGKPEKAIYATIQNFKGLDRKIVILFSMERVREEVFSKYMYIVGIRARTLLYIVGTEEL